jgi:hypothetical protein
MFIEVEYFFADESTRSLKNLSLPDAVLAAQDFPWDKELPIFENGDGPSPEVRLARLSTSKEANDVEAHASILKWSDGTWTIVAEASRPGQFLGLFPVTKKTDIVWNELGWEKVEEFMTCFYRSSRDALFTWMKERR